MTVVSGAYGRTVRRIDGFERYVLALQYDGSAFKGWSKQPHGPSVEQKLLDALDKLCGNTNHENLQISSRTDRGVHALFNTCHVDLRSNLFHKNCNNGNSAADGHYWEPRKLQLGLNYHLKIGPKRREDDTKFNSDVIVYKSAAAPRDWLIGENTLVDWHARHSATARHYQYRILIIPEGNEREHLSPFFGNYWRVKLPRYMSDIMIDEMRIACQVLEGEHDFSSFRGKGCQRSSPCVNIFNTDLQYGEILDPFWRAESIRLLTISISGSSFIYRQVRNMVGCLMKVGLGKLSAADVKKILDAKDRRKAPSMAPAHGLYLCHVEHDAFSFDETMN